MGIVIKFILKNVREKKLRAFLVIFSIMASTALFFASSGTASTIKKTFTDVTKQYLGDADVQIYGNSKSPSPYMGIDAANVLRNNTLYIIGEMDAYGTFMKDNKENQVMLRGFNYDDVKLMNPLNFYTRGTISPFVGNKIIISKKLSDENGLTVGDKINIKSGNGVVKFTIVGIAENSGFFALESDKTKMGIIPMDTAGALNKAKGLASSIYLKVKGKDNIDNVIKQAASVYKNYTVEKAVDEKAIEEQTGQVTMAFRAMMMIVLLMSMFIIYTVFKIIVAERLPVIGTFRSIGATKFSTSIVLIGESLVYGIVGGITGDVAGIEILKILGKVMGRQLSDDFTVNVSIDFTLNQLISAFIFALFVSFISSIIPIIKTARLSVKDVVLNTAEIVENMRLRHLIIGIGFIIISIVVPKILAIYVIEKTKNMIILIVCMILSIVGIIVCVPYITELFVRLFENLYGFIFGNEGILAAKNLRKNRSLMNNIALLTIGISTIFMLNVVSYSMGKEIVKAYGIFKYDVWVENDDGNSLNRTVINKIMNTDGVREAVPIYFTSDVEIQNTSSKISGVYFLSKYNIKNYLDVKLFQNEDEILKTFDDGRNIIMTVTDMKKLNKKVGDNIVINTTRGNRSYKIVASFNTLMNNGSSAIIPEKYAKGDFKLFQHSFVYLKTYKSSEYVKDILMKKLKSKQVLVKTMAQRQMESQQQINKTLFLMKAFPILALIIGAIGVLNNFVISFIERKRYLAIYASVGMSRAQTRKMLFIEAVSVGIIGSICGIVGGILMTEVMPFILKLADFPMDMHYSKDVFIMSIVLGIFMTVLAAVIPSFKSSRMNIIEAIKYE